MAVQSGMAEVISVIGGWMDEARDRKGCSSAGHSGE
jgi:hypothetical protein